MYSLPQTEINNAMERGYSAEALEQARQLLVRVYYHAFLAYSCGDEGNSRSLIEEEFYFNGRKVVWEAVAYADEYMDRDGALLLETDDYGNTEVVLDLSHVELRHLWEVSRP